MIWHLPLFLSILQDTSLNARNRTLVVDNNNLEPLSREISTFNMAQDGSRTWLPYSSIGYEFDEVHIFRKAHLVLHENNAK